MSKSPISTQVRSRTLKTSGLALGLLTVINLLNYVDRYIFSALLPAIKADLHFTDTQLGILGTAFLLSYVLITPFCGYLGDRGNRSRLMAGGVAVWSVATAFSGICTSYVGQLVTRAMVGVGESAYIVIAPSTISDHFSKRSRGKVFAVYSGAIPVGSALGYMLGGWLEPRFGWQKSFFVVGVPGLILALILFFLKDPPRGQSEETEAQRREVRIASSKIYKALFRNGGFIFTSLGYAAYTFVLGGMAFWMPTYLVRYFDVSLEKANIEFGALTVVGGFIGTLLGGYWADYLEKRSGNGFLKVSFIAMLLSAPLFWLAIEFHNFNEFLIAMLALEIALFLPISPLDAALVSYVRPSWRATSTALNIAIIHVLGDGISRTLLGVISDQSGLRAAMSIMPWFLLLAGVLWFVVLLSFWQPMKWPEGAIELPMWQAHRGFRREWKGEPPAVENTILAFRRARALGATMVECDVRWSADRQVVVFHDDDLNRLGGRPDQVASLKASELKVAANIPLLSELLTDPKCPSYVNIEIKTDEGFIGSGLEVAVAKVVDEAAACGRVLISSFNPLALRRMARAAPNLPRALLVTEEPSAKNKIYLRKMWFGFLARPHMLNLDNDMIDSGRLERWAERGLNVGAWTINDAARARELVQIGVKSVISDHLYADTSS